MHFLVRRTGGKGVSIVRGIQWRRRKPCSPFPSMYATVRGRRGRGSNGRRWRRRIVAECAAQSRSLNVGTWRGEKYRGEGKFDIFAVEIIWFRILFLPGGYGEFCVVCGIACFSPIPYPKYNRFVFSGLMFCTGTCVSASSYDRKTAGQYVCPWDVLCCRTRANGKGYIFGAWYIHRAFAGTQEKGLSSGLPLPLKCRPKKDTREKFSDFLLCLSVSRASSPSLAWNLPHYYTRVSPESRIILLVYDTVNSRFL